MRKNFVPRVPLGLNLSLTHTHTERVYLSLFSHNVIAICYWYCWYYFYVV